MGLATTIFLPRLRLTHCAAGRRSPFITQRRRFTMPATVASQRPRTGSIGQQAPLRNRPASAPSLARQGTNVGDLERWASILGGGATAVYGLTRGGLPGLLI